MKLNTILLHSARLYGIIINSYQPGDKIASDFFRSKKYIGSKERRFMSEIIFTTQRIKSLAEACFDKAATESGINTDLFGEDIPKETGSILTACILLSDNDLDTGTDILKIIPPFLNITEENFRQSMVDILMEIFAFQQYTAGIFYDNILGVYHQLMAEAAGILSNDDDSKESLAKISAAYSMPEWILESLIRFSGLSLAEAAELSASMLKSAPLCLRVNLNLCSREDIIHTLENENIAVRESRLSPAGIIIEKRVKIDSLPAYKNGLFEVQDIGSQLISYALGPEEGDSILDACAGAGGKSIHIASLQNDTGEITSSDVGLMRLKQLSKRSGRSGFKSIKTKLIKLRNKGPYFNIQFDKMLIDAPCSGMGTVRRMPMQKWRLTPKLLEKHAAKQLKILNDYRGYLKPGGILVYSTCSFMPQENAMVINKFLEENPDFMPDPLAPVFADFGIEIPELGNESFMLSLYPHLHESDGFFMARLIKQ